jgi:hypothetical protein
MIFVAKKFVMYADRCSGPSDAISKDGYFTTNLQASNGEFVLLNDVVV